MFVRSNALLWIVLGGLLTVGGALAQEAKIPPPQIDPPPARDVVAARVNGQVIPELAVYRSLMRVPAKRRDAARAEVLNYLIDNMVVDQYLMQLKIDVDAKSVEENFEKIKKEAADQKKDLKTLLAELIITEDELRTELTSALRWDRFVLKQGSDKVLQEYFKANLAMFNGSETRARHILIPVTAGKKEDAIAKLTGLRKNIEDEVAKALLDLPATTDAIQREQARAKAIEKAFAQAALKESTCPSKKDGGDLGFFPRAGAMVEPFARAAFGLKPYQMSEPVATEFGFHLILTTDSKAGKEVQYDKVKPFVQEVYGERLREAVLTAYKTRSKIEIVDRKK